MHPFCHIVGNAHLAKANPRVQAFGETRAFRHTLEGLNNTARNQAEITSTLREWHFTEALKNRIKAFGKSTVGLAIGGAINALAIDHVKALPPFCNEGRDHLWRVLQISINHDHCRAAHMVQASGERYFLAEVAAERNAPNPPIVCRDLANNRQRSIRTAIIHKQNFVRGCAG